MKAICKAAAIPVVADIHFHYKRAIEAAEAGAACLRINPGNIGSADRVREVVKAAKDHGCAIRIGVNAGSLEKELMEKYGEPCPEAMVESALSHARILDDNDFREYKISVKASDAFLAVASYRALAEARMAGCTRITLLTDNDNRQAMRLYARAGFVRSAMVPFRLSLRSESIGGPPPVPLWSEEHSSEGPA